VVVHVAVALTDDAAAAYTAMKRQLGIYPRIAEYARMFRTVGFENPGGEFEDGLLRELVIHGSEAEVRAALDGIAADGVTEVLASLLDTGSGVDGALAVLGAYCRDRGTSGSVAGTAGTGVS
jgi:alkanesulfonate monooxygenase SsuD/methylene tetrahydromethanopterin reductase-like flavin-dependent oxidoreductase (luciferase family)